MGDKPIHLTAFCVFTLLIISLLSACERKEAVDIPLLSPPIAMSTATAESVETNGDSPEMHVTINPLTGLSVQNPDLLERRPVMVKISNFPRIGRPHAGLSFADIVFDYYIGHGTNRFLAMFYGQDAPEIGPVRSGRRVDAQLVTMYGGVLGYGSADADTDEILVNTIGNYAISHLEAACPAFCGEDTHDATGVFANSAAISDFVDAQGWANTLPDLQGLVFNQVPPEGMKTAEQVNILFNVQNRAEWRYDPASGKYLRWIEHVADETVDPVVWEMVPLTDRVTGEQLAFANVIIIFAPYAELAPSAHEIAIWGNTNGLPAYFFRDGGMIEGEWMTVNDSDPMQFITSDGMPMTLKPGNTWIAIVGLSSTFREIQPGTWEIFFFLP